jgi:hypothetical protein
MSNDHASSIGSDSESGVGVWSEGRRAKGGGRRAEGGGRRVEFGGEVTQDDVEGWAGETLTKAATSNESRKNKLRKEKIPPRISTAMNVRLMPTTSLRR